MSNFVYMLFLKYGLKDTFPEVKLLGQRGHLVLILIYVPKFLPQGIVPNLYFHWGSMRVVVSPGGLLHASYMWL